MGCRRLPASPRGFVASLLPLFQRAGGFVRRTLNRDYPPRTRSGLAVGGGLGPDPGGAQEAADPLTGGRLVEEDAARPRPHHVRPIGAQGEVGRRAGPVAERVEVAALSLAGDLV